MPPEDIVKCTLRNQRTKNVWKKVGAPAALNSDEIVGKLIIKI